ncbi:uncharacterized protein LOC119339884 [Triticum dicoccoides]|uniref:uncharacterized protein LOC119339884 n=1 Tax=Triticum dicoccoides TaxID=85692 RepID=UPI001890E90A|nr:uncharacterized protein LOC119339884 [Triticum dicoccoides]
MCLLTCLGHIAAETANSPCLSCHVIFVFLLVILEAAIVADVFLNSYWEEDKSHQIYIVGHFACWINILLDIYCWSFCLLDRSIYCWIYKPSCCCSLKHAGKKNDIWHINRVSQGHGTWLIGILCHGEMYKPSVPDAGTRLIGYV